MYERFTDRARAVMKMANQEAQHFSHEYIGTEHILLGLVKEGTGVAASVLKNLGIDLDKVRVEIAKIILAGSNLIEVTTARLPQTPRAKRVIDFSIEESRFLNHNYVGTEHLLLGILREDEGVAAQVLINLGLTLASVHDEVLRLLGIDPIKALSRSDSLSKYREFARLSWAVNRLLPQLIDVFREIKENAIAVGENERAARLCEYVEQLLVMKEWVQRDKDGRP